VFVSLYFKLFELVIRNTATEFVNIQHSTQYRTFELHRTVWCWEQEIRVKQMGWKEE
jgi:hypothetical protein